MSRQIARPSLPRCVVLTAAGRDEQTFQAQQVHRAEDDRPFLERFVLVWLTALRTANRTANAAFAFEAKTG